MAKSTHRRGTLKMGMTSFLTVCISYYVSKGGTLDEALSDLMPRFDSCLFTRLSHEIYPLVLCFLVNFFRVALDSSVKVFP